MGVTIGFTGRIRNRQSMEACLSIISRFADEQGWTKFTIPRAVREVLLFQLGEQWYYKGYTSGIEVWPHTLCEPFRFEVFDDLSFQDFCTTQFAPIKIHILIVRLLRELSVHFETQIVDDEGDYYQSENVVKLKELRARSFRDIKEQLRKIPGARAAVRSRDGRISDVVYQKRSLRNDDAEPGGCGNG